MSLKNYTRLMAVVLAGSMLFTGCGKINSSASLVSITNGDKTETVTLGYGNFVARYNQALYDMYYGSYMGEDMWTQDTSGSGSTMQEETKESIMDEMETWYVSTLHAGEYGVSLSDDEKAKIAEAAKAFIDSNSEAAIKQMGATEEYVSKLLTDRTYAIKVRDVLEKEAEGKVEVTDDEAKQSTFSYVMFEKDSADSASEVADVIEAAVSEDGGSNEDADAEARTQAEAVAASTSLEDAASLSGVEVQTYSYTTSADPAEDSYMDEAVIKAAASLSEGQMSDVIEAEDGFYVIRLDQKYDKEATETKKESLKSEKISDYCDEIIDGWKDGITWTVNEKNWAKVEFAERFSNGAPAEETSNDVTDAVLNGEEVDLSETAE